MRTGRRCLTYYGAGPLADDAGPGFADRFPAQFSKHMQEPGY